MTQNFIKIAIASIIASGFLAEASVSIPYSEQIAQQLKVDLNQSNINAINSLLSEMSDYNEIVNQNDWGNIIALRVNVDSDEDMQKLKTLMESIRLGFFPEVRDFCLFGKKQLLREEMNEFIDIFANAWPHLQNVYLYNSTIEAPSVVYMLNQKFPELASFAVSSEISLLCGKF